MKKIIHRLFGWHSPSDELKGDIAELSDDAMTRLQQGPVVIPPAQMWSGPLFLPLLMSAFGYALYYYEDNIPPILIPILGVSGFLVSLAMLWEYRTFIHLTVEGVHFKRRKQRVFCPWAIFDDHGKSFLTDKGRLIIPAHAEQLHLAQLFVNEKLKKEGDSVRTGFFEIADSSQIWLRNSFNLHPTTVAELIGQLAGYMSDFTETASTVKSEHQETPHLNSDIPKRTGKATLDRSGRVILGVTHYSFPPVCCCCNQETEKALHTSFNGRRWMFPTKESVDVSLPCCKSCKRSFRFHQFLGTFVAWVLDVLFFVIILWYCGRGLKFEWTTVLGLSLFLSIFPIMLVLRVGPSLLTKIKGIYFPFRGEIRIKFSHPEYAQSVVDHINNN